MDGYYDEQSTNESTNDEHDDGKSTVYVWNDDGSTISAKLDGTMDEQQYKLSYDLTKYEIIGTNKRLE